MDNTNPIGIFDSGVGGLTVVRAIHQQLPNESVIYLGDTARVPYGTKSAEVVNRYALKCAQFLRNQGAKSIIIACNTASAVAVESLIAALDVPVLGVIDPGAEIACRQTQTERIGVIGTHGTIESRSYHRSITAIRKNATVISKSCPLFVPLAEEGLINHPATRLLAEEYLLPFMKQDVDTLVLGCTHYPLLQPLIQEVVGPTIRVIDSASAVAQSAQNLLQKNGILASKRKATDRFFSTDTSKRFSEIGREFLGNRIQNIQVVDL